MRKKITDIFDEGYTPPAAEADVEADPEAIRTRTFTLIHDEEADAKRRCVKRRVRRTAITAAALAAVLLTGIAATLISRSIGSRETYESKGIFAVSSVGVYSDGSEVAREYLALREWTAYREEMNTRMASGDAAFSDDERIPFDEATDCYAGDEHRESRAKLEQIASEYGLKLHETVKPAFSFEEFYSRIGSDPICDFLPSAYEDDELSAYVYNDGGFEIMGMVCEPDGLERGVSVNLYREMRGVMPGAWLPSWEKPDEYEVTEYETKCGKTAELALGPRYSFIFVELANCWVTVEVSGGSEENPDEPNDPKEAVLYPAEIGMSILQEIADAIDFAALEKNS